MDNKCNYQHDHMILTLVAMYPHLSHWKDYRVMHPFNTKTGEQSGDPYIVAWLNDEPRPTDAEVKEYYLAHQEEICAQYVRYHRDDRLQWSDRYATVPVDAPPSVQAKFSAWLAYRAALRDITNQPGFPLNVEWPEVPAA